MKQVHVNGCINRDPVRKIGEVAFRFQSRKELHHMLRGFRLSSTALAADDDALRPCIVGARIQLGFLAVCSSAYFSGKMQFSPRKSMFRCENAFFFELQRQLDSQRVRDPEQRTYPRDSWPSRRATRSHRDAERHGICGPRLEIRNPDEEENSTKKMFVPLSL